MRTAVITLLLVFVQRTAEADVREPAANARHTAASLAAIIDELALLEDDPGQEHALRGDLAELRGRVEALYRRFDGIGTSHFRASLGGPLVECGVMLPGEKLVPGEQVESCDGHHVLAQQHDGNLVLYHDGVATWASNTQLSDTRSAIMQNDGNLVLYGPSSALWAAATDGHVGSKLAVQNDGNLVIYDGDHAVWASGTNGR